MRLARVDPVSMIVADPLGFRVRKGAPAVVLMYHHVADCAIDPLELTVHPTRFAAQMAALRTIADVVPPGEVVRPAARPVVAVTFDDGYVDNLEHAAPVLEANEIPACIFSTDQIDDDAPEFWWDQLDHLLLHGDLGVPTLELDVPALRVQLDVRRPEGRMRAFRFLNRRFRRLSPHERVEVLDLLHGQAGRVAPRCAAHRRLGAAALRAMDGGGLIEIGGHTSNHVSLGASCDDALNREIRDNRTLLTRVLGRSPALFAYPYGDHDARSFPAARAAGYELAFSTVPRRIPMVYRPYNVPRVFVGDWTAPEFTARINAVLGV